jgi:hypothetical protein
MWRNVPLKRRMDRLSELSVPAVGTGLPNFKGSGDFGTSPFYGQLPGQASFSLAMRTNMARRAPKHNEGFKKITVSNFIQTRPGWNPNLCWITVASVQENRCG